MIELKPALVIKVLWARKGVQGLEVECGGEKEKALNYPFLTGEAADGDNVILNTTAQTLRLGSGGYHFVLFNFSCSQLQLIPKGHIMKLRYTPLQLKVNTFEENYCSGESSALEKYRGLNELPVAVGELHSMLAPFVFVLKRILPTLNIAYIMNDDAALPLYLSDTVYLLQSSGYLRGTVTCGHAFGGDIETVNFYSALIAAKEKLKADIIISTPGPGVVGTATRYGNSGIKQGDYLDKVFKMHGTPVALPRISFADLRNRHRGLSHHTLTALGEISFVKVILPLPILDAGKMLYIFNQVTRSGIAGKHKVVSVKMSRLLNKLASRASFLQTMGKGLKDDPSFFAAVAAGAYITAKCFWSNPASNRK